VADPAAACAASTATAMMKGQDRRRAEAESDGNSPPWVLAYEMVDALRVDPGRSHLAHLREAQHRAGERRAVPAGGDQGGLIRAQLRERMLTLDQATKGREVEQPRRERPAARQAKRIMPAGVMVLMGEHGGEGRRIEHRQGSGGAVDAGAKQPCAEGLRTVVVDDPCPVQPCR
jgi:hypothetical protein